MSRVSYDGNKAQIIVGYSPGRTDDRYPNFIKALKLQTDDCIAYSILIGQSLASYGKRLTVRYGDSAPRITEANFVKAADLLPDMAPYADWMTTLPPRTSETRFRAEIVSETLERNSRPN
jgi:hypothetical protein